MTDTAQIIIVAVITILTIILAIVGIQVVFILQEIKRSLTKVNNIVDDVEGVTSKIAESTSSVSGMMVGLKTALSLLGSFNRKKNE
jgi:hypothetical protein